MNIYVLLPWEQYNITECNPSKVVSYVNLIYRRHTKFSLPSPPFTTLATYQCTCRLVHVLKSCSLSIARDVSLVVESRRQVYTMHFVYPCFH